MPRGVYDRSAVSKSKKVSAVKAAPVAKHAKSKGPKATKSLTATPTFDAPKTLTAKSHKLSQDLSAGAPINSYEAFVSSRDLSEAINTLSGFSHAQQLDLELRQAATAGLKRLIPALVNKLLGDEKIAEAAQTVDTASDDADVEAEEDVSDAEPVQAAPMAPVAPTFVPTAPVAPAAPLPFNVPTPSHN